MLRPASSPRVPFERRYLDVSGARVYYQVAGSGDAVVLIHGLSGSGRWWRRNAPALAARFRVFVIDLVGFGRSRGPFKLAEGTDVLADWMTQVGLRRAHLVGHSMGGYLAADLAASAADRDLDVDRLVLVDAAAFPLGWRPVRHATSLLRAVRYMDPSFLPVLATDALRAGPRTLLLAAREVTETDLEARCAEIGAPTLVVWGEHDRVVPPAVGERLTECLPDAELVVIEGAGHNPMWDRPAAFNEAVLGFLTGEGAGPTPASEEAS
jgi:pimeloyl-ACP methyl ester carboxylesterase